MARIPCGYHSHPKSFPTYNTYHAVTMYDVDAHLISNEVDFDKPQFTTRTGESAPRGEKCDSMRYGNMKL